MCEAEADMAASVVYESVPNTRGEGGTLFQGQKFWFSATVPQRQRFVEIVKANGGEVVPLEKQADILLVDHKRKNPAPGTHSYQYVELSIRHGKLEKLDDHVVCGASRADRPVGSITMAPKGGRNHYTEADDQFLWNWVKPLEEAGGAIAGNTIYQQLEAINARHTYQSWRDRWLKYVRHQKREITTQMHEEEHLQPTTRRQRAQPSAGDEGRASVDLPAPAQAEQQLPQHSVEVMIPPPRKPSPDCSSALPALKSRGKTHSTRNAEYEKAGKPVFSGDDYDGLFEAVPYILATHPDSVGEAWQILAKAKQEEKEDEAKEKGKGVEQIPTYLAEEWRAYFETVVLPDYDEQLGEETGMRRDNYSAEEQPTRVSLTREKALAESTRTTSPDSPTHRNDRKQSPSFQPTSPTLSTLRPESPMPSFSTIQDHTPGPDEAQKQSAGRGASSQESTDSTVKDANGVEELSQIIIKSPKRKRYAETDEEDEENPSLPPFGNQERAKRSRKSKEEPRSLEIPSTPDANALTRLQGLVEQTDPSQELGSPTPRPRHFPLRHNGQHDVLSSPLSVPPDHTLSNTTCSDEAEEDRPSPSVDSEDYETSPSTPRQREKVDQDSRTSPLSVHLVSDHDPPIGSSFSQTQSERGRDNGSPTPEFETAPEFSQIWETAQEEGEAAERNSRHSQDGTVAETQPQEDFALPEPEGGWDDLTLPSEPDEGKGIADGGASLDEEDTASEEESMGSWVAAHLEADPDADDELLIRAAGIADLDFRLADIVYQHLARGKSVPENMKGVWTEKDDMALRGNDAKEIRRVEEKHGKESLADRWHWLENEQT